MTANTQKKSFIQDLIDRRFFRFFGTYLGVCFALLQFSEFVEKRFSIGEGMVEKLFILMALMVPAVAMYIYNHGRPGHDQWLRSEKIFIPINFLVAGVVAFFFGTAGAAPVKQEVSIVTEEGDTLSMMMPTLEHTHRVAIFPFKSEKTNWKGLAASRLLDFDLEQDLHFIGINPNQWDYDDYDQKWLDDISFSTQLKIAQDNYSDYFLTGAITEEGDQMSVKAQLYDANNGEVFYEKTFEASGLYDCVDEISREIKQSLILPETNPDAAQVVDLPSKDLITKDLVALESYIEGLRVFRQNLDKPQLAIPYLNQSVTADPECAECYSLLASLHSTMGNKMGESTNFNKALSLSATLPERQKMEHRSNVYQSNTQFDKWRILMNNWIKLYPADYKPYERLMNLSERSLNYDDAIAVGEKALANGHSGPALRSLASLSLKKDDLIATDRYFKRFQKEYPHKAKKSTLPAKIFERKGDFKSAQEHLQSMSILDPTNIGLYVSISQNQQKLGDYSPSEKSLNEAYNYTKNIPDSMTIMTEQENLKVRLGKINDAITIQKERFSLLRKIVPPISADMAQLVYVSRYVLNERNDEAIQYFESLRTNYSQIPIMECLTNYMQAVFLKDKENFLPAYDQCKDIMISMNGPNFEYNMNAMKAYITEDYQEAAENMKLFIDSSGFEMDEVTGLLAKMLREGENYEEARDLISEVLTRDPTNPNFHFEKAHILTGLGEVKEAQKSLQIALDTWKDGDANYSELKEALELKEEIGLEDSK